MPPYSILISDIVRRENSGSDGVVELYCTPMIGLRYERRGVIVRVTADTVTTLLEPRDGESDVERHALAARLTVCRDLVMAVRLVVLA